MGSATSKAENYVNACITAGIEVVNRTLSKTESHVDQTVHLDFSHCTNVNISHIDISQLVQVNVSAATTALTSTDLTDEIRQAVQDAAESGAEAGLLEAGSETKIVSDITLRVTDAITNECQALASAFTQNLVELNFSYCSDVNISYMKVGQTAKIVEHAFTKSKNISKVKRELTDEVEENSTSKAKGFDPTLIIIAIVILVVVLMLFPVEGVVNAIFATVAGVIKGVGKIITTKWTWVILGIAATGLGLYLDISTATHTWPSSSKDSKEKRKNILIGGSVTAGAGALVSVIMYFVIRNDLKKGRKI